MIAPPSWFSPLRKLWYLVLQKAPESAVLIQGASDVQKARRTPCGKVWNTRISWARAGLTEAFANACGCALIFIWAVINDFTSECWGTWRLWQKTLKFNYNI